MTRKTPDKPQDPSDGPVQPPPPEEAAAQAPQAEALPSAEDLAAERDDLLGRLQRLSADYANYQKRAHREMADTRQFASAELIRAILPVLDDMERALEAGGAGHPPEDPLLAGMKLVYEKALEVLGRFGLKPMAVIGEPFDPGVHDAILQQPSQEHDVPTVVEEVQRGYELKGRVLRPARVVVSAPVPPAKPETPLDAPGQEDI